MFFMVCGCEIQGSCKNCKVTVMGGSAWKAASANRIYAKQINSKSFIKKTYKIFLTIRGLLYNSGFVPYNGAYVTAVGMPVGKGIAAAENGEHDDR